MIDASRKRIRYKRLAIMQMSANGLASAEVARSIYNDAMKFAARTSSWIKYSSPALNMYTCYVYFGSAVFPWLNFHNLILLR